MNVKGKINLEITHKRIKISFKSYRRKLHDTSAILDRKYGVRGTATRTEFEERAIACYYAEILRDSHLFPNSVGIQ